MEAHSFARNVERQVRKALKTERVEGEYQQKEEKSVRYRNFFCLTLLFSGTDDTQREKFYQSTQIIIRTNHCIAEDLKVTLVSVSVCVANVCFMQYLNCWSMQKHLNIFLCIMHFSKINMNLL